MQIKVPDFFQHCMFFQLRKHISCKFQEII